MTDRPLLIKLVCILLCFAATLALCSLYGPWNRKYAASPGTRNVGSNREIFRLWEQERVRGRILYIFDRHNDMDDDSDVVTDDNFVHVALRRGIIREVHHVIPRPAWSEVRGKLAAKKEFRRDDGAFVMPMPEGRLYVSTIDGIRGQREKVLIVINRDGWNDDPALIDDLVTRRVLGSDLIVVRQQPGVPAPGPAGR